MYSSLTPSESNLFNTDSFLLNLLHEMEIFFLTQMKILLTKRNIIQQIIEIIKRDYNFTYLYNEHVDNAFHLKESLIRNLFI